MKTMRASIVATALATLATLATAISAHASESHSFGCYRDILRDHVQEDEILAFSLDPDLYGATRPGFPDLRIRDDAGGETPLQIEAVRQTVAEATRGPCHGKIVSLRELSGAIEILLKLHDDAPVAAGMRFVTPLRDFRRKVRIAGSGDGKAWTSLVDDGVLFDYARFMDVSNAEFALPANAFRWFKITIEDVADEKDSPWRDVTRTLRNGKEEQRQESTRVETRPFRIDRIELWSNAARVQSVRAKKSPYAVAGFRVELDADAKQTIVYVDTHREPITSFALQTQSRNFRRRATVEIRSSDGTHPVWRPVGDAVVYSFRFRELRREQCVIDFGEHRADAYRIVIANEDNPPLAIDGVDAVGNVYRAVFLGAQDRTYRVQYGSETATAPNYEAGAVLEQLRTSHEPVEVRLGPPQQNEAYARELRPWIGDILNSRIILGSAVVLMVVILGYGLFRAGRRMEPPPEQ